MTFSGKPSFSEKPSFSGTHEFAQIIKVQRGPWISVDWDRSPIDWINSIMRYKMWQRGNIQKSWQTMSAKCIHDGEVPVPDLFPIYCPDIFCQKFAPLLMEPRVSYERKTYTRLIESFLAAMLHCMNWSST